MSHGEASSKSKHVVHQYSSERKRNMDVKSNYKTHINTASKKPIQKQSTIEQHNLITNIGWK